jgi:hypothetical protein
MELKGKRLDLLQRADECAQILGHPKHTAGQFKHLSPGERGIAVALQEYVDAQLTELRSTQSIFQHQTLTKGDAE